jgi:hypothetical protein
MYGPEHYRKHREPREINTDDLVAAYGVAAQLRAFEIGASIDGHLDLWMFAVKQELTGRDALERIRDYLPVYIDPTRRNPVYGPRAALPGPPGDAKAPPALAAVPGQIAG